MTPERMQELFFARTDVFAQMMAPRPGEVIYQPVRRPITFADTQAHLDGRVTLGTYQLDANGNVLWLCIDIDILKPEWLQQMKEAAVSLGVRRNSILLEFSGSKGYHLWVFFAVPVAAADVRKLGEIIVDRSGCPRHLPEITHPDGRPKTLIEVFPKQEQVTPSNPYGNLVKLPFGIHKGTGQMAAPLEVVPIVPMTPGELSEVLEPFANVTFTLWSRTEAASPARNGGVQPRAGLRRSFVVPCTEAMMAASWSEGGRNEILFLIAKRLANEGMSEQEVIDACLEWNQQHCSPPLSAAEVRKTARSGMRYTSFNCLHEQVIPFCSTSCPIWAKEHPATPPDPNVHLKMIKTDPAVYLLPLTVGTVRVLHDELLDWERIRKAVSAQNGAFLGRRSRIDWDRELQPLMDNREEIEAPPETGEAGTVIVLLWAWLERATEDPMQLLKRSVWRDDEHGVYVFQGPEFIRYVQTFEKQIKRNTIWTALSARGTRTATRHVNDSDVDCWEVPIAEAP